MVAIKYLGVSGRHGSPALTPVWSAKLAPRLALDLLLQRPIRRVSALQFYGLTTQNPLDVWLAIGHKDRQPAVDAVSLCIVRMSGEARTEGVETHEIEGVSVPIYEHAKTVADCFKYRSRVGLDVALEALRDFHEQGGSIDALWHYADLCHVQTVIRPYMEAVTS